MDKATRDAALWVLEELELIEFFNENIKKGKLEEVINDEFIEYLQNILFDYLIRTASILHSETHMMKREVEALRRYIEVGQKRLYSFRRCNLGKILEENIEVFKPVLAQKDIEIEYTPPVNLYAKISEIDIDRVICNLLHNANKYSHKGPGCVVRIKTRDLQQENALELIISSLGIPITKREIENRDIFKFGYRSRLAFRTDRDGTGVGLADAKDVIEQHHGKITITSEPIRDDGDPPQYKVPYITTVTVSLPKTRNNKEDEK
jgi:signal transduction histidine kinase